MREKPSDFLNPFVIGAMVDDSRNLRTTTGDLFEPFISPKEVKEFDNVFSSLLNDTEKRAYEEGKRISINKLVLRITGTTLN